MQSAKNPQHMGETIQQHNEQMKHIANLFKDTGRTEG